MEDTGLHRNGARKRRRSTAFEQEHSFVFRRGGHEQRSIGTFSATQAWGRIQGTTTGILALMQHLLQARMKTDCQKVGVQLKWNIAAKLLKADQETECKKYMSSCPQGWTGRAACTKKASWLVVLRQSLWSLPGLEQSSAKHENCLQRTHLRICLQAWTGTAV